MVAEVPEADPGVGNRLWSSRRALLAHAALLVWFPGCVVATWWQVGIARSGVELGWAYTAMWPGFAVFGVAVWWHVVHDDPGTRAQRRLQMTRGQESRELTARDEIIERAEAEDPELASYNAYLASLARRDGAQTWSSP